MLYLEMSKIQCKNKIGISLYRELENLDGEHKNHYKLLSYRLAEKLKILVLVYLIEG